MDLEARNLQRSQMSNCLHGSIQPILPLEIAKNRGKKRYHHNFMFLVKNMCMGFRVVKFTMYGEWPRKKLHWEFLHLQGGDPHQIRPADYYWLCAGEICSLCIFCKILKVFFWTSCKLLLPLFLFDLMSQEMPRHNLKQKHIYTNYLRQFSKKNVSVLWNFVAFEVRFLIIPAWLSSF